MRDLALSEDPAAFKAFLACPISQHMQRGSLVLPPGFRRFIQDLRLLLTEEADEVFLALDREAWGDKLMPAEVCTPLDFAEMLRADVVVAYPGLSCGVGVELGWASALGKPIVLVLDERTTYSPMVLELRRLPGAQVENVRLDFGGCYPQDKDLAPVREAVRSVRARRASEYGGGETAFSSHGMIGTWWIGEPERAAAAAVVQSKSLFRHYGPRLRHEADAFEQEVQSVIGVRHALAMSSGTAALRSALRALDLRPGQEVLVPSCTFIATSNAVVLAGGVPVFCEVDEGLGLDPGRLHDRVTSKTAGIIAVHLQGEACRIEDILAFARAHDLWLIEDAAQALGVRYQNRMAGAFGDIGVFSLQAHKTITCGEGGLLVTEDPVLYARARRFHDQGGERIGDGYPDWEHEHAGFGENFKISELQAAVARVQLTRLNAITQRMREVDGAVRSMLPEGVELRKRHDGEGALPCALTFYVREQRERAHALERLAASGIPADAAYSDPIYRTGPYRRWADGESVFAAPHFAPPPTFQPCPDSERLLSRMVRIPLSPLYGPPQLERIAEAIRSLVEEGVT